MSTTTTLLTPAECAYLLGINPRTLANWRSGTPPHRGPLAIKVGGRVRYRLADVERYIEQQTRAASRRSKTKAA
ncbi:MAG: helix-turn-helix domain-containing protein [Nocardioides sp.]|nr:helix-turn-helix domain-containing protein [Nocardioides sp.]